MKIVRAAQVLWASSLLLLLAALVAAPQASAQSAQQTALARSLFEEGVRLADVGDWESAADRFGRAHSLKPTAGIAFNWARALSELGQLLQAQELLQAVLRDPAADGALKHESETRLQLLEGRVARLRVTTGFQPSAATTITVDDTDWPRAAWGFASPVDPGPHTVVAKEGSQELTRVELVLSEGERRELTLAPASGSAASDSDRERRDTAQHRRPLYKSWWLWSAVGAVVVGGVVTGVLLAGGGESAPARPIEGNTTPGVLRW